MRTGNIGFGFGLLHFAFNLQLFTVINHWVYFTGGNSGVSGISRPAILTSTTSFYLFVFIIVLICYILMRIILSSPFRKVVQGIRENEERLTFLGINTKRFHLVVFIIGGLFASLAGILLTMLNLGAFPDYFSPLQSAEVLMMILIGGMSSFMGPTIGAGIAVFIDTEVSNYVNQWQGILGVIIILCVLIFRGGIHGRRKNKIRLSAALTRIIPWARKDKPRQKRQLKNGTGTNDTKGGWFS
jgi:branched-chain amino acid transport system permease protein